MATLTHLITMQVENVQISEIGEVLDALDAILAQHEHSQVR